MRTLTVELIGKTPLLLHRVGKHQERSLLASKALSGKTVEQEAEENMLKDTEGNPAISGEWFFDALRVACSKVVVDGKQLSFFKVKQLISLPQGVITLERDRPLSFEVYSSMQHAAPDSKEAVTVIAPLVREWRVIIPLTINGLIFPDNELLSDATMGRLIQESGKVGIGLFHPPKKHFGQFRCVVR